LGKSSLCNKKLFAHDPQEKKAEIYLHIEEEALTALLREETSRAIGLRRRNALCSGYATGL